MFEDSIIEGRKTASKRWIALTSVAIQGTILTAFIVVPLIWPETLPLVSVAPKMTSIALKKPEVKIQPKVIPTATDNAYHGPAQAQQMTESRGGGLFHHGPTIVTASEEPSLNIGINMGGKPSLGIGSPGDGPATTVVAATPRPPSPLKISQGVSAGLLLAPIRPIYPRIAVMARVEGTVVVTAIIDKQGRITGLQVLSGPDMLKSAAVEAVKEARYRPYLLNGEPTEVITTISVNFRMSS
jgi:protein TonB